MNKLLIFCSIVSWSITACVSIWLFTDHQDKSLNYLMSDHAFNVIDLQLAGITDSELQIEQIQKWKLIGLSDKTGAIKTLCLMDKDRLSIIMNKDAAEKACRITRTTTIIDGLTPI